MSPLLITLNIINDICDDSFSSAWLAKRYGLSDRTFKRHIDEARHLGAVLKPYNTGGAWYWECENADQLRESGRLARWIALEKERDLVG